MAFLKEDDLLTFATSPDEAMAALEPLIESIGFKLLKLFGAVSNMIFSSHTNTMSRND